MDEAAALKYERALALARYLEAWRLRVDPATCCTVPVQFGPNLKQLQAEFRRDPAFQAVKPCYEANNPDLELIGWAVGLVFAEVEVFIDEAGLLHEALRLACLVEPGVPGVVKVAAVAGLGLLAVAAISRWQQPSEA